MDYYAVLNKPLQLVVLLWSLHLVCSQQVTPPMDCLSDIHPALQTLSSNMPKHMVKTVSPTVFDIAINATVIEQSYK